MKKMFIDFTLVKDYTILRDTNHFWQFSKFIKNKFTDLGILLSLVKNIKW